jgi:hypothetical protein
MVIAPARPMVLSCMSLLGTIPPNRLLLSPGEAPFRCVGNEARAQNRAHECFVFGRKSEIDGFAKWNFGTSASSSTDFLLDDTERRCNFGRQIDGSVFMKKASLRRMRGSPTYSPPRLRFLTLLS